MIPPGTSPYQSKYNIGDRVQTTERGRTGDVLMIHFDGGTIRYLLDCHPGALGYYDWVVLPDQSGHSKLYAANWLTEDQIEGLVDGDTAITMWAW